MAIFQISLVLLLLAIGHAQFIIPPPSETFKTVNGPLGTQVRYKEMLTGQDGICELNSSVKSYSGFVDVAPHEHIFFWLFEARDIDPQDAHFTAWISGGPGDSSMRELFTEHGPCKVDAEGRVTNNPHSWNAASNIVYIDQPVQVGFSYSDPIPGYVQQDSCDVIVLSSNECPSWTAK